jgi:catechol 2,3-dioxygenase-like lactoylglutathione lyase family enzyme
LPIRGVPAHIDLSVSDPNRAIPFYDTLLTALGYRRLCIEYPEFQGTKPQRAAWQIKLDSGAGFEIEVRPASGQDRTRAIDRYAPGLHHLAFHSLNARDVDAIHRTMEAAGATVLDAPADYGGRRGYCPGYYAAFYADPDGIKLEVAYIPDSNP